MADSSSLSTIVLVTLVSVIIVGLLLSIVFYTLQRNDQRRRYDSDKQNATLDSFRANIEEQIYSLTGRLMSSESRWEEVNHLIASSQRGEQEIGIDVAEPRMSRFLESMGLKQSDLQIDRELVFVLTPFHPREHETYSIIRQVCVNVGFKVLRGDEDYISGDIFQHILRQIASSRLVIANVNGRNPNVYYELGVANAIDKPTIVVSKSLSEVPFDLRSRRIVLYDDEAELHEKLGAALTRLLVSETIP